MSTAHLFLSIDIINSTKDKAEGSLDPMTVWSIFWEGSVSLHKMISSIVKHADKSPIFKPWKSIGDEVVFITSTPLNVEINTETNALTLSESSEGIDLVQLLSNVCKILDSYNNNDIHTNKIKGTLWMVPYSENMIGDENSIKKRKTIELSTMCNNFKRKLPALEIDEYYGTSLDHGFRIAGMASEGNLVVSGLIVHTLAQVKSIRVERVRKIILSKKIQHTNEKYPDEIECSSDERKIYCLSNGNIENKCSIDRYNLLIRSGGVALLKGFDQTFSIFTISHPNPYNLMRMSPINTKLESEDGISIEVEPVVNDFNFDKLVHEKVYGYCKTEWAYKNHYGV